MKLVLFSGNIVRYDDLAPSPDGILYVHGQFPRAEVLTIFLGKKVFASIGLTK